jgi:hypothetical protein
MAVRPFTRLMLVMNTRVRSPRKMREEKTGMYKKWFVYTSTFEVEREWPVSSPEIICRTIHQESLLPRLVSSELALA